MYWYHSGQDTKTNITQIMYIKMTTHYTLATVADSWDQHNDPWPSQTEKNHQIQPLRLSRNKMWIFEKDIIAIKLLYFDNN